MIFMNNNDEIFQYICRDDRILYCSDKNCNIITKVILRSICSIENCNFIQSKGYFTLLKTGNAAWIDDLEIPYHNKEEGNVLNT